MPSRSKLSCSLQTHLKRDKMTRIPIFFFLLFVIHSKVMADADLFLSTSSNVQNVEDPSLYTELPSLFFSDKLGHQFLSDDNDNGSDFEVGNGSNNPYANWSVEQLWEIEKDEHPTRDPWVLAIIMTIIYSIILVFGIVGNVITCIVIATKSYMHTATNYYLFSLAISDLLLLISGLPQEIYHIWVKYPYIFGEAFCVIRGIAAETSCNATVLTITAFTVERFFAIIWPLKSHKLSQLSRVVKMVFVIWITAFSLSLPQGVQFGLKDEMSSHNPETVLIKGAWCTLVREIFPYAFEISVFVFFVAPMLIITVLYILIGLKLRRSSRKGPLNPEPRTSTRHSQSHVIRMLVCVVVCFFLTWGSFQSQRLMALYGKAVGRENLSKVFLTIYEGLTHVSGVLYFLSTCINPILYHTMSNKFRQAFKDTFGHLWGRPSRGHHSRTYSAISHSRRSSRMLHFTSTRNPSNSLVLAKNSQLRKLDEGNGNGMKVEKSGAEIDIVDLNVVGSNSNNYHHGRNSNGKIIKPCSCSGNDKMIMEITPKPATTSLSNNSKSSFVTRTYCPVCGGSNNTKDKVANGKGRGVTFGFLGKAKARQLYKDEYLSCSTNDTAMTPLNSSPEKGYEGIPLHDLKPHNTANGKPSRSLMRLDTPKKFKNGKPGLRAFLCRKMENGGKSVNGSSSLVLSSSGYHRPPSEPSTYASVTILQDSNGKPKSFIYNKERKGSVGNLGGALPPNTARATSCTSIAESNNTNTISNSSLQDLDEVEFTSEELAGYMAELNLQIESPQNV